MVAWIKREAARRGIFMAELVSELIGRALGGKKPWES
jgi:hypothetical protein